MGINLAIVGSTGAVGQTILDILRENNLDFSLNNLKLLASENSAGTKITFGGKEITVEAANSSSFHDVDIAIFSAGSSVSKNLAPKAVESGAIVIDNSSAFRMDDKVPLVAAGVNYESLYEHEGIIANPNCSTIQMVCALKPILDHAGIKRIVVSTYQSVSGTGYQAMKELTEQSPKYLNNEAIEKQIYPHQIAFNMLPHLDSFDENGDTKEELKMVNETKKIFQDENIGVTATTVRVPVFIGHSEAVNIETKSKLSACDARQLLENFSEVEVIDDPFEAKYPTPIEIAGKDQVYVGRIREDLSIDNGLNLWVVADNLRRGAAFNALLLTEYLAKYII
ncbi:aspartate-semialdehyde dehydrogenase [Natranaerobius thermophilus]|uniref:Aspartate-semialdehyde dehydrogenase n=1 Tax=Natranaerobius thermophilus (strain ATCC BAA-1301 / DSM 18059 / JW/NM-WN-LF) TaxID=457570 RepID=B2A769_NATTJ|nr:aspartate-semialdehyde dehydrogenase [Natranaerobius thermophilus]ACB84263.1 aspartate semialdehyde dehydrogenase [Natranaerobius thermophilus JW/NM-WN-LF]